MLISAIVAMTPSRLMGVDGKLPWHVPEDLKHFKETTRGHAVLMGRKTFESIGKKPLPKRRNLVITRQAGYEAPGAEVFTSVEAAVAAVRADGGETELFIVGGSEIYALAMGVTDKLVVTWMTLTPEPKGDTFFPVVEWDKWREVERRALAAGAELLIYERVK